MKKKRKTKKIIKLIKEDCQTSGPLLNNKADLAKVFKQQINTVALSVAMVDKKLQQANNKSRLTL